MKWLVFTNNKLDIIKKNFTKVLVKKKQSHFDEILSTLVFDSMVDSKKIKKIDKLYSNNNTKSIKKLLTSYKFGKTTQLNHHYIFSNTIGLNKLSSPYLFFDSKSLVAENWPLVSP